MPQALLVSSIVRTGRAYFHLTLATESRSLLQLDARLPMKCRWLYL